MDNLRFGLLCAAGVIVFFLWQAWQVDYAGNAQPDRSPQVQTNDALATDDDVPSLDVAPDAPPQAAEGPSVKASDDDRAALPGSSRVRVVTDKMAVSIALRGGDLRQVELLDVPVASDRPETNLRLLNDRAPNFFIAQSGLIGNGAKAPDHRDSFESAQSSYRLRDGQQTLQVPLTWRDAAGREVRKVYTFERGSYQIDLRHEISNDSSEPWTLSQYLRFWRTPYTPGQEAPFAYSFTGVGWYQAKTDSDEYRFEKVDFEDLREQPLKAQQNGGWISMMQHYFLGAVVPPAGGNVSYFAEPKPIPGADLPGFAAGYVSAKHNLGPGESGEISTSLFIGPKLQEQLVALSPGLELTIDYGLLTFLAEPLFWVLDKLHSLVGNWGWAIVLLTVIIKLVFYKLSEAQYRAMARMRKFAPRIQQIKEQYGDDKEKLQSKMMDLYKKEGFNPLGGCWPMLVQMPVFIALYWVLRESVELRQAPFMLWIQDLSSPDPYYILPVLFGITMWFQQKLSSSTMAMDPMQARMMQVMPVAMAVFFAFFPSGLVLYWFTNNLLSIAQQWYIYRKLDNEGLGHKAAAK